MISKKNRESYHNFFLFTKESYRPLHKYKLKNIFYNILIHFKIKYYNIHAKKIRGEQDLNLCG
jgi:hypothetical protein